MNISSQINTEKETNTERNMTDIVRIDLSLEINEFSNHVQSKIERLDERMRFVNYKFEDVRFWFKRYSISIIYLATFLTLIESFMNSFNLETITTALYKNFLKFTPLILSSLVSLIAAIIKFNKYEEKIEDITRATEKCIITIAKLKEVKEELYFCKTVEDFLKINERFTRDIYTEYLESNTNIERQLLDTDYAKYMKRVAHNDVARAKILIKRNLELDELQKIGYNLVNNRDLKDSKNSKNSKTDSKTDSNDSNHIPNDYLMVNLNEENSQHNIPWRLSLSAQHNSNNRKIPYRGISPPPTRSQIYNKKMKPMYCKVCKRNYLLDINNKQQRCPHCGALNLEDLIELVIDNNKEKNGCKNEIYAKYIQKAWRSYIKQKI